MDVRSVKKPQGATNPSHYSRGLSLAHVTGDVCTTEPNASRWALRRCYDAVHRPHLEASNE